MRTVNRTTPDDEHSRRTQRGYLMAGLASAITVMVIFSTLAFQEWIEVLRRDNEAEMMFRAQDMVRAIQRYRRDHGGVAPIKLEQLMEPGPRGQYYLRKMWTDPLVRDGKWGLLYIGPGGQIIDPNAPEQAPGGLGSPGLGGGDGRADDFFKKREDEQTRAVQQLPGGHAVGGQQTEVKSLMSGDAGADENAGGRQLAGLQIGGVRSLCEDEPFRVYNGLTEYSEWRFTYLDLEAAVAGGTGPGGAQSGGGRPGAAGRPGSGQPPGAGRPGGAAGAPGSGSQRNQNRP